ncbi:hypothetical protein EST38_g35 [Candolleomyces aberdarensis]|uniref:Transcription regulator Rua1 C-terminal domain-containing protein n=1 Tax=Candolleomyces aberdarensis TaxID=2316362 RepID=A0A4V1Q5J5_9AGAR|nr:hypothetical protein EST38_g35 [Candolleomyces aberdarensis]
MQYSHGISAASGKPFSPPLLFRMVPRKNPAKTDRKEIRQGKCHKCSKWVAVEGVKDIECKVKELHWWKHAASCHNQSTITGEEGVWEEDKVYKRLVEL